MTSPICELKYIEEGRIVFATRFPNGNFDDNSWDIRHLRASQHNITNPHVYFTKHGSVVDPLPTCFSQVVKAFLLLMDSSGGTMPLRVDSARMLWKAIEKRSTEAHFSWNDLCEEDLLEAEQQMLQSWGADATYKRCTMLRRMVDTLAAAPYGSIVRPISVVFRTPRQEDFERYTLEGRDLRQAKMPTDAAIFAIGRMFSGLATNERDRLMLCALALLLATGSRIGEVLTLPLDCEITEGSGAGLKHGLRYYKEKSPGGEKLLAVHWLTVVQADLAKAAIAEARILTETARMRARVLERNPDTVPLPGVMSDQLLTTHQVADLLGCQVSWVHDFKVTPCPKFLNCVKDCEDYVLDTANKGHINNLVQLQTRTELILDQARQQKAKGEEDLSENWIAETEATLSGVQRILDAASITTSGTVQPFKGKRSRFGRFPES
jgi:hypothetical protein